MAVEEQDMVIQYNQIQVHFEEYVKRNVRQLDEPKREYIDNMIFI